MEKSLFLMVWNIYQDHWGRGEQQLIRSRVSANHLQSCFRRSSKMRAFSHLRQMFKAMWDMRLYVDQNEVVQSLKDMSEACMEEDYMDGYDVDDPVVRMQENIHLPCKDICLDVHSRQWSNIRTNIRSYGFITNDCIYRVSALIVLSKI